MSPERKLIIMHSDEAMRRRMRYALMILATWMDMIDTDMAPKVE